MDKELLKMSKCIYVCVCVCVCTLGFSHRSCPLPAALPAGHPGSGLNPVLPLFVVQLPPHDVLTQVVHHLHETLGIRHHTTLTQPQYEGFLSPEVTSM